MDANYRRSFNANFTAEGYERLFKVLARRTGERPGFRVAETPIFLPMVMAEDFRLSGERLLKRLLGNAEYMKAAQAAIPTGWACAGESAHPNFLTADFALVKDAEGAYRARLVEIQAFPSLYGFQSELVESYREAYELSPELETRFDGMSLAEYWRLMGATVVGGHDPKEVVLLEVDPKHQKTRPDFVVTSRELGIAVVDVRTVESKGRKLFYRDAAGQSVEIKRIYNRVIADELVQRKIELPFAWTGDWDVEWAGHPNWYFLVSKFSLPWLTGDAVVPPSVFVEDFLTGNGAEELRAAGVEIREDAEGGYENLLLKPLYSFAGKGIEFAPTRARLEAIPQDERKNYLLQERMEFEKTIATPEGATQAEVRILSVWPAGGELQAMMPLVRLGRGKMMGVDHNRDLRWVGSSAGFLMKG